MSLDEFKSPLPPRKVGAEPSQEPVEEVKETTTRTELPVIEEEKPISSQPVSQPGKKINKNLIIFGGIGVSIILILALVFGVIIPKLGGGGQKVTTITYWGLWENNLNNYSISKASFFADSQLMIRQVSGIYKVKSPNIIPLYQSAKSILSEFHFPCEFQDIRREYNKLADELANQAMDSKV